MIITSYSLIPCTPLVLAPGEEGWFTWALDPGERLEGLEVPPAFRTRTLIVHVRVHHDVTVKLMNGSDAPAEMYVAAVVVRAEAPGAFERLEMARCSQPFDGVQCDRPAGHEDNCSWTRPERAS